MWGAKKQYIRVRFLYLIVIIFLSLLLWPLWYPWLLRLGAYTIGVQVDVYVRKGYAGCELRGLKLQTPYGALDIESVVMPGPLGLLLDLGRWNKQYSILIKGAAFNTDFKSQTFKSKTRQKDVHAFYEDFLDTCRQVSRWLPPVRVRDASLHILNTQVSIKSVDVGDEKIILDAYWPNVWEHFLITLDLSNKEQQMLEWLLPKWDFVARFWLEHTPLSLKILTQFKVDRTQAYGEVLLSKNEEVDDFSQFKAKEFHVPAGWLYPQGKGMLLVDGAFLLQEGIFRGHCDVTHQKGDQVFGHVQLSGDADTIILEDFYIKTPSYTLEQIGQSRLNVKREVFDNDARFKALVDLSKCNVSMLAGYVSAEVSTLERSLHSMKCDVSFDEVSYNSMPLNVEPLRIEKKQNDVFVRKWFLSTKEASSLELQAKLDLDDAVIKELMFVAKLSQKTLTLLGIKDAPCSFLEVLGDINGVWSHFPQGLNYGLSIRANRVVLSGLHPFDISWIGKGKGFSVKAYTFSGLNENARISCSGLIDWYWDRVYIKTNEGSVWFPQGEVSLQEPFDFYFQRDLKAKKVDFWWQRYVFHSGLLRLQDGKDLTISFEGMHEYGMKGTYKMHAADIPDSFINLFLQPNPYLEAYYIRGLYFSGDWSGQSSLEMDLQVSVDLKFPYLDTMLLNLNLISQNEALDVEGSFFNHDTKLVQLKARLPVYLTPGDPDAWLNIMMKEDFFIDCTAQASSGLAHLLKSSFGVYAEGSRFLCNVSGKPFAPRGILNVAADVVAYTDHEDLNKQPFAITDSRLDLIIEPEQISLQRLDCQVEGRSVSAQGSIEMETVDWKNLFNGHWDALYEKTLGHITLDWVPLAPLDVVLPKALRPQGHVYLNIGKGLKQNFLGTFALKGLGTYPIEAIGSIAHIYADCTFEKDAISLNSFHFELSDRPVDLKGSMTFGAWGIPQYDFRLLADDVPFIRSPGLVLRSSLDLRLKTDAFGVTALSGDLDLKNSILVVDLATLQGSATESSTKYPYFSITEPLLSDWSLDLNIKGDRFMRVQTPLFKAILSCDFHLSGAFSEPTLLGEVTMDEGSIYFPFATFKVTQGDVRVSKERSTTPVLSVNAKSRAFGYDLRCNIEGPVDDPLITFSSLPSLDSNDVLAMVTTGKVPPGHLQQTKEARLGSLGVFLGNSLLTSLGFVDVNSDRLEIITGEDITESGRSTMSVEYHLSERASIVGEYDRFDDLNGDFKYTIFTR